MVEPVLIQYFLGAVRNIKKITTGLIHETYKVETSSGDFILQKVHPIFGKAVMEDVDAVSQELVRQGITAQTVVRTRDGNLFVEHDGGLWRLLNFIPGEVFETISEPYIAHEAGKMLGSFHRALDGFDYEFKHSRPLHHNTHEHLRLLKNICFPKKNSQWTIRANCPPVEDWKEQEMVAFVFATLPQLFLPTHLRRTITQGDPKITNFIFQNQKAVALIDIDDVGRNHNVLIELGDAFRSWCGKREDDPKNSFDISIFEAGLRGYQEGSQNFLTKEELTLLPQTIQLITLELASRFLRDYFEDNYFGWDENRYPSRKAHNFARAKGQLALYHAMMAHEEEAQSIIHHL